MLTLDNNYVGYVKFKWSGSFDSNMAKCYYNTPLTAHQLFASYLPMKGELGAVLHSCGIRTIHSEFLYLLVVNSSKLSVDHINTCISDHTWTR